MRRLMERLLKLHNALSKHGSVTIFFHPNPEPYKKIVPIAKELGLVEEDDPAGYATKGMFNIKIFKPII